MLLPSRSLLYGTQAMTFENSTRVAAAIAALALMQTAATAQPYPGAKPVITYNSNNTGGRGDRIISYGPTGADTVTTNSAAGGNASRPELAIPNGSAGGGGGGSSR